jgi:HNH endonuclease
MTPIITSIKSAAWVICAVLLLLPVHVSRSQEVLGQPRPILPDPKLTARDVFEVSAQDICVPGYSKKVRNVPTALKRQAYARYDISQWKTGDYEVDHLIPLSLGGSNSIKNLWPQSTQTNPWNSYAKDALERRLHNLLCAGKLDLRVAQHAIASNWIEAYKKYVGSEPPAVAAKTEAAESSGEDQVWVNLRSHKYWKPGSRFYGKTSRGEYMPEIDALDRGYKPAGGTGE